MRASLSRIAAAVLALAVAGSALAETRIYRYSLTHRSGDPRHAGEVTGSLQGLRYRVQTDAAGRLVRSATLRDGKATSESVYLYSGDERLPSSFESYTAGELRGRGRIQRNADGDRVRTEFLTLDGALTNYTARTYAAGSVHVVSYSAAGKKINHVIQVFSAAGFLLRSRWYPADDTYYENEVDEKTGLVKARRKLKDGQLESSTSFTYGADGDLAREDVHDPGGNRYGMREYRQGLKVLELYKFADGSTVETRVAYDEKRTAKDAKFLVDGKLICTFTFERLPNGRIKRTLAIGPQGELMAEYPDEYVDQVNRTGSTLDREAGKIYKKGDWW